MNDESFTPDDVELLLSQFRLPPPPADLRASVLQISASAMEASAAEVLERDLKQRILKSARAAWQDQPATPEPPSMSAFRLLTKSS